MCLNLSFFNVVLGWTVIFYTSVIFGLDFLTLFFSGRLDKDMLSTHMPLYGCCLSKCCNFKIRQTPQPENIFWENLVQMNTSSYLTLVVE